MSAVTETPAAANHQTSDKTSLRIVAIVAGLCLALGIGMLFDTARRIVRGIEAEKWTPTEGIIKSAHEDVSHDSEGNFSEVKVKYQYRVGGKNFGGDTIHPAYGSGSPSEVNYELLVLLKAGRRVRVYYNPVNPEESTLAVGFYSCSYERLAGTLAFFGFGLGVLLICWFALKGSQDFAGGITIVR